MDSKERATVMIRRRGNHEDRLRQAMVDGLVRKEIQQDVEKTLAEAAEARRYAEHMEAQAQISKERERAALEAVGLREWQIREKPLPFSPMRVLNSLKMKNLRGM